MEQTGKEEPHVSSQLSNSLEGDILKYSRVSNKRGGTLINFSKIFHPTHPYSIPYVYQFNEKFPTNTLIPHVCFSYSIFFAYFSLGGAELLHKFF